MEFRVTYTGCTQEQKRQIEELWQSHQQRVEAKLQEQPVEPDTFELNVEHESEFDEWSVHAQVQLSSQAISTTAREPDFSAALEQAIDQVVATLDEASDGQTESNRRRHLKNLRPRLDSFHAVGNQQEFLLTLQHAIDGMRAYLLREIHLTAVNDDIDAGPADADDVLSALLLEAWEHYEEVRKAPTLDSWMMDRIHDSVGSLAEIRKRESVSLEQRQPSTEFEPDETEDPDKEFDLPSEYQTFALEDVLPGAVNQDNFDGLEIEEKQLGLALLLSKLPRPNRQVLVLTAADGYDIDTVADLLGRSVDAVQQDLVDAERILQSEFNSIDWAEVQEAMERRLCRTAPRNQMR